MELDGKTILITGASRGLGRELAVHFAGRCRKLIVAARNEAGLDETKARVEAAGGVCQTESLDLRDASSIESLAERVNSSEGGLDVLINNAADVTSKPFSETSMQEIESLLQTNVVGPLQLTRLLLSSLRKSGTGCIVNISSLAGYKPNASQTVYSLSKTAVNGMSDALRNELSQEGVHVLNAALPSVSIGDECSRGEVPFARFAARLERGIGRRENEVYLSPVSKWLMRLYKFYPPLARIS